VQALVFGEIADDYERVRPGYPAALIDDVIAYAPADPRTLDVGAGTGKATVAFAERGLRIVALEPDPAMAAVLRERVAGHLVDIDVAALESHEPAAPYDLIYSAQAFHWTAPETRWSSTASFLRPGGALALFWNHDRPAASDVRDELYGVLREYDLAPTSPAPRPSSRSYKPILPDQVVLEVDTLLYLARRR
jgi:SAM-dependent methyltransferase